MHTLGRAFNFIMIILLLGMIFSFTACSKTDENGQTVGQKVDNAIDKTNAAAERAGQKMENAANKAGDKMEQGAEKAKEAVQSAAADVKEKAGEVRSEIRTVGDDSAITASVKTDLLKDPKTATQKVEVRTDQGNVTLTGSVDNAAAKQRATEVAAAVSGVQKVNNEIQVASKGKSESRAG